MNSNGFINLSIAKHKTILWLLAIIITLASAVYQRMTGPTYPVRGKVTIGDQKISYKLLRSEVTDRDAMVRLTVPDSSISGYLIYKRYRSNDEWLTMPLLREKELLTGYLPKQPAAGKIMYSVHLRRGTADISLTGTQPIMLRFKGAVPGWVLIPHILIIFFAMLLSNRTALEALDPAGQSKKYMLWTIGFFMVGGLILVRLFRNSPLMPGGPVSLSAMTSPTIRLLSPCWDGCGPGTRTASSAVIAAGSFLRPG